MEPELWYDPTHLPGFGSLLFLGNLEQLVRHDGCQSHQGKDFMAFILYTFLYFMLHTLWPRSLFIYTGFHTTKYVLLGHVS